ALWHADFGGYPSEAFLGQLSPKLAAVKKTLGSETFTSDVAFGTLSPEWAQRLGLPFDVTVAVGAFDAHIGAVGGGISAHRLIKVMGTSTCDIVVSGPEDDPHKLIAGICGQVDGSVIPGLIGYEAGQSAFGDVYAWFKALLTWPLETILPNILSSV